MKKMQKKEEEKNKMRVFKPSQTPYLRIYFTESKLKLYHELYMSWSQQVFDHKKSKPSALRLPNARRDQF